MDGSIKLYSYIASQCQADHEDSTIPGFVTISRQAGAGGITIGEKLADYLNKKLTGKSPWTVFDKNLVDEVMDRYELPKRILPYFKEARVSAIEDALEDLLGVHPPHFTLVEKTNQTIMNLARRGRTILVGRGSSVITRFTEGGVHIRLVGSTKARKKHIEEHYKLTDKEAEAFIDQEDIGRTQYLKKYFDRNVNDPLLYDVVINTDMVSYDDTAMIIGDMVIRKIKAEMPISI